MLLTTGNFFKTFFGQLFESLPETSITAHGDQRRLRHGTVRRKQGRPQLLGAFSLL